MFSKGALQDPSDVVLVLGHLFDVHHPEVGLAQVLLPAVEGGEVHLAVVALEPVASDFYFKPVILVGMEHELIHSAGARWADWADVLGCPRWRCHGNGRDFCR